MAKCKSWLHKSYQNIAYFLKECVDNDYDLDKDDIEHILQGDFEYIRKQNK